LARLFGEIPIVVPSSVLGELANALDKNAKAALALARKYHIAETELSGDDAVIDVALKKDSAVVTNDRELIRRLRALKITIVRLRGERYLVADEF
jgi:rRNA-processing protein FCF1